MTQELSFTGNLLGANNRAMFYNIEEAKEIRSSESIVFFVFFFFSIECRNKITQYSTLKVTLSNSQLNRLNLGIKNGTEITFKTSANVVRDSNDKNSFPHKFLLTNTHVSRLRKNFPNNFSLNMKLSKTRLHKIGQ